MTGKQYLHYDSYIVYEDGRIYSKIYKKFLKPVMDKGYWRVFLCHDKAAKTIRVHRIIATCFIPNPNNYPHVNHIDGDKGNNRADNLEWVTRQGNMDHAHKAGLSKKFPVGQYEDGQLLFKHASILDAERATKIQRSGIHNCLTGKSKTAGGYTWKLLNP